MARFASIQYCHSNDTMLSRDENGNIVDIEYPYPTDGADTRGRSPFHDGTGLPLAAPFQNGISIERACRPGEGIPGGWSLFGLWRAGVGCTPTREQAMRLRKPDTASCAMKAPARRPRIWTSVCRNSSTTGWRASAEKLEE